MSEPITDNVNLFCNYYKPKEQYNESQSEYIKHRDFVSCNGNYNYVSYVDTGATNKVPEDYTAYVGNKEKSCGAFNENGILSDTQKREIRESLRTTQSCIWDMLITFRTEFGDKYCRDYEQAFSFVKSELPKFFKRAGLNPKNVIWYAGLHENTENKHIHISFFEKEPTHFANGGKLTFHTGTIPKKILINSKFVFEKKLTNATAELVKAKKDLIEKYNSGLSAFEFQKKGKKMLLRLYEMLPSDGRISYDSENMLKLKKDVDGVTEFVLTQNKKTRDSFLDYKLKVLDMKLWKKSRYSDEEQNYMKDMFRRLGNKTIQTALELGKLNDNIEKIQVYNRKQKAYKKQQRKFMWDKIFAMYEYFASVEEQEMKEFKYRFEERERYAKEQEYYRRKADYDYEM